MRLHDAGRAGALQPTGQRARHATGQVLLEDEAVRQESSSAASRPKPTTYSPGT